MPAVAETVAAGRDTLDLAEPDSIRAAVRRLRPDVIVNAAGLTHVDQAETQPQLIHAINAVGPGILAEEAKRLDALLVHYSSVYVFDGMSPAPYRETDPPRPINAYGRSKLAGEEAIAASGARALILRASWVYDTRGRNFVLTMLRLARERDELRVVDDQIGSPMWAKAMAEATVTILRDVQGARETPGIYNLGACDSVSRFDFTRRMLELHAETRGGTKPPPLVRIKTADYPLPAPRPLNSTLATERLSATFDAPLPAWEPQLRACLQHVPMPIPCPS